MAGCAARTQRGCDLRHDGDRTGFPIPDHDVGCQIRLSGSGSGSKGVGFEFGFDVLEVQHGDSGMGQISDKLSWPHLVSFETARRFASAHSRRLLHNLPFAPDARQPRLLFDWQTGWTIKMHQLDKTRRCHIAAPAVKIMVGAVAVPVPALVVVAPWVGAEQNALGFERGVQLRQDTGQRLAGT